MGSVERDVDGIQTRAAAETLEPEILNLMPSESSSLKSLLPPPKLETAFSAFDFLFACRQDRAEVQRIMAFY